MEKNNIKEIIANILYIDDINNIIDDGSLFTKYELNSIDYIDLCFELSQMGNIAFNPEDLWPVNKFMTDPALYSEDAWTHEGWDKVCETLTLEKTSEPKNIAELYEYFTVNYIHNYLSKLA